MQKKKIFISLAIFWLIIISGFIAVKEYTLQTGQEVLLQTVPIDPRDLFRGDYVILQYDISTINTTAIQSDKSEYEKGDTVYVSLDAGEKYVNPRSLHTNPPDEGLFIKGRIEDIWGKRIMVKYNIESYFVPEGEGRVIERQLGGGVEVKASIDKLGNAAIKALLIDGREVHFD